MYIISPSSVHLTWHAARVPSTTSHLSPTTYRVEVREDGTFNWVERASNITGLGCDIGGLNPMLDYAFRVRAVNDFGWSEATLPVFLHRPIGERLLSYTTVFLRVFFICVASSFVLHLVDKSSGLCLFFGWKLKAYQVVGEIFAWAAVSLLV